MRSLILLFTLSLFVSAVGCANEDGTKKTTMLIIDNSYTPSLHSDDCKDGIRITVNVKGRTHQTPVINFNDRWDYELTQEKTPTPYTIETSCFTSQGKTLKSKVSGEIPAADDDVLVTGIHVGPPRVLQAKSCLNTRAGEPCIAKQN